MSQTLVTNNELHLNTDWRPFRHTRPYPCSPPSFRDEVVSLYHVGTRRPTVDFPTETSNDSAEERWNPVGRTDLHISHHPIPYQFVGIRICGRFVFSFCPTISSMSCKGVTETIMVFRLPYGTPRRTYVDLD